MKYKLLTILMLVTTLGVAFAIWQYRVEFEAQRQLRMQKGTESIPTTESIPAFSSFDIEDNPVSPEARRQLRTQKATKSISNFSSFDIGDDPVSMIRVLNALIALGQADCVEVLRQYDETDSDSNELIGVVIPLLFSPQGENAKYPTSDYSKQSKCFLLNRDDWHNLDVELFDDIPFGMDCLTELSSGMGFKQSHLVDWAESAGAIRGEPLRPTADPFGAADLVAQRIIRNVESDPNIKFEIKDRDRDKITIRVREQVYSMLKNVLNIDTDRNNDIATSDIIWKQTKEHCVTQNLHWDPDTQQYAFSSE